MYSQDIPKICTFCQYSRRLDDDKVYCEKKKRDFEITQEACKKYKYDILKREVRRKKSFKTDLKPEDFEL